MRVMEFASWVHKVLAETGGPDIVSVEPFDQDGVILSPAGLRITFADGTVVLARTLHMSSAEEVQALQDAEPDVYVPPDVPAAL